MNKVKSLIIGLGNIGCGYDYDIPFLFDIPKSSKRIWTHSRAIACHPNFELIAGIDNNNEACRLFQEKYKRPVFKSITNWLNSSDFLNPDFVIIAVPPEYQINVVEELLERCIPKILLLEKPIASNLKDLIKLNFIFEKYKEIKVFVNYIRCYLPAVKKLNSIIEAKQLGNFIYGNLTYGKGLLNSASHFINLAELLLGQFELKSKQKPISKCIDYDEEINLVLSSINYPNSEINIVSISKSGLIAGELDLWFEHGRVLWPNNGSNILIWYCEKKNFERQKYHRLLNHPEKIYTDMNNYQIHVLNELNAIYHQKLTRNFSCPLNSGFKTLELLLNIKT